MEKRIYTYIHKLKSHLKYKQQNIHCRPLVVVEFAETFKFLLCAFFIFSKVSIMSTYNIFTIRRIIKRKRRKIKLTIPQELFYTWQTEYTRTSHAFQFAFSSISPAPNSADITSGNSLLYV